MNQLITVDANPCTLDWDELLIKLLAHLTLGGAISTLTAAMASLSWFLLIWMQNYHSTAHLLESSTAPDYYDKCICDVCVIKIYTQLKSPPLTCVVPLLHYEVEIYCFPEQLIHIFGMQLLGTMTASQGRAIQTR